MRYCPFLLLLLFFASCEKEPVSPVDTTPYVLELPPHFPYPDIPEDNELTEARVALGKMLFFEPAMSVDSSITCGACHKQSLAFADDLPISPGVRGRLGFRNSPTLVNLAYLTKVNKDGGVPKLDIQALVPIEDHAEMDLPILHAAERLNADPEYVDAFQRAYGELASPFTITRALGAFQRTLISANSTYDQYLMGEVSLNAAAERGRQLFFSDATNCSSCHGGFNFTENGFFNNGLYETYEDWGRRRVTGLPEDDGVFRVPTLRNIALTAPYMHDGSLPDLQAVLEHYNTGGTTHPNKDNRIQPLHLSTEQMADLEAFLHTLTDTSFLTDQRFKP
ncbi:MAG: cytochrome-c peroxidase [Phaeodactylibacter xiamenensis]|uniref:Cytochrome C peroxidase n=1 Tax=Phaeodactylibacter xiamenensis TaxID=1524460 RepID=A0A098S386_9BACT|nr:cytochrome c peroxidase [Phaeodactylibacter xiamenensis]KGE86506.1 cytochrome C peroxidase [Phaeodactylibacter xiamenensis]MCR9050868.1 c-type cytochrome [bacterium]